MNEHELVEQLREKYVKDVVGERKPRNLEDALQEALDNTTPEFPGTPNEQTERTEDSGNAEWI